VGGEAAAVAGATMRASVSADGHAALAPTADADALDAWNGGPLRPHLPLPATVALCGAIRDAAAQLSVTRINLERVRSCPPNTRP
jgi:hypothetical protein